MLFAQEPGQTLLAAPAGLASLPWTLAKGPFRLFTMTVILPQIGSPNVCFFEFACAERVASKPAR